MRKLDAVPLKELLDAVLHILGGPAVPEQATPADVAEAAEPGRPLRVLVAEDNPFYCRMLEGTLKGWGYEVVTASTGLAG